MGPRISSTTPSVPSTQASISQPFLTTSHLDRRAGPCFVRLVGSGRRGQCHRAPRPDDGRHLPIMRYHPAIIAQAAATLALLSKNRFTLGLGSGERLNEHIVGAGWPGLLERRERFTEAVDIIQGLLTGKLSNYRGKHLQLDHARLFDRPTTKPAVVIAAT